MPKLTARLKQKKLPTAIRQLPNRAFCRLRRCMILPLSVLAGLIPSLIWLLAVILWQELPNGFSPDFRPFTLAVLLISPFIAGFVRCRHQASAEVIAGAAPAFWLWAAALVCRLMLLGPPGFGSSCFTLGVCLLLGIAGGMSAQRIESITHGREPAAESKNK